MLNRLGVLGGALLLSACSLINSYDEVLPGDGGGSPTSSSTSTTSSGGGQGGDGGGATTTTSSGGGQGGDGGQGGEGGGGLPQLNCSFSSKSLVHDVSSTVPSAQGEYDAAYPFMNAEGLTRMLVSRRSKSTGTRTLQLIEVSPSGAPSLGSFANPVDVLDVRRINSGSGGGIGALVQMSIGTNTELQLMVWEDGAPLATFPTQYPLLTFTGTPTVRAVFDHVGPAAGQIDYVVAMPGGGGGFDATYRRRGATGNTVATIPIATGLSNPMQIAPKALLVFGNTVHAFLGDTPAGAASRQYVFESTDTSAGAGFAVGPIGSVLTLAERFSGTSILSGAIVGSSTLSLRLGNRNNNLVGADELLADLPEVESFTLGDQSVPSGGRPTAAPSTLLFPGTLSNRTRLSLRVFQSRTDVQTGLRFRDDDVVPFSGSSSSFGDVAVAATPAALGDNGGLGAIFFSEVVDSIGERLYQVRFNCTE